MLKKEKNVKNGDTDEKRKPKQPSHMNIYRFFNLQRQDAGSYYFVAFLNYPSLSIESESVVFVQKIYRF